MHIMFSLVEDNTLSSKEEWDETVKNGGYKTEGEWTGTLALYALARREDAESWTGENIMTNVIPHSSGFAYNTSGDVHYDNYIDENGNLITDEQHKAEAEKIEAEIRETLREIWAQVMKDCNFTEGTAGEAYQDNGATHVTYNGSDTLTLVGVVEGENLNLILTKESDRTVRYSASLPDDEEETEAYDAEAEKAKYNEGRVDSFLQWNDGLDDLNVLMASDKVDIRATAAADNNELNLDNLKGESRTWNYSPPAKRKTLTLHEPGAYKNVEKTITVSRSNNLIINSYAIHNFSDGSDWYIVRFGGTLNPSGQYKREDNDGRPDYVWGHTGYYTLAAVLDPSASGITLIDTAPKNANKTQTKTIGLTLNLNGKIGVSDKGGSGEIGGGVSSTKSTSYTTSDYDTVNDSVGVLARVHYMFAHPTRGSKGNGIAGDGLEDAVVTSRGAFSPNLQAVWKVDKSCWQKNGVQRKMISQLVWSDAIAQGNICAYWVTVREEKQEDYPDFTSQYAFTLQPPMHFALGKKNVVANKEAQTYAFTILSEGNWSTEMSAATASWCSLSETSGGPTNGGNEKQMMLQMTENNTGRIRRGEIKFKLNSGGQKETHTLTVEQAPTSKIIN